MKKIAIFSSNSSSLINFRGKLLEAFIQRGHVVYALSPLDKKIEKELLEIGVRFIRFEFNRTGMNPFSDILVLIRLIFVLKKIKPDVLISYTIKPVLYVNFINLIFKLRSFSLITGLGFYFFGKGNTKKMIRFFLIKFYTLTLKASKKGIFQNQDNLKYFLNKKIIPKEKSSLIEGSGVDLDYFYKMPLVSTNNFLMSGRLIKDKGVYEFIEAAKTVKKQYPSTTFTLIGGQDDNPSSLSEDEIDELKKENIIEYLGFLDDPRDAIISCSCFVLPSHHEGLPRSTLEAMSMGRAIITTDAPGCKDTVLDGVNGFVVPVADHLSLSNRMLKFIEEPSLCKTMGEASRVIAEKRFDVHLVNSLLISEMNL